MNAYHVCVVCACVCTYLCLCVCHGGDAAQKRERTARKPSKPHDLSAVWCGEREKGRTFRYSRVLARRLNYLEAQMVFSSILLPNSWDFGRPREILDMNDCPHTQ